MSLRRALPFEALVAAFAGSLIGVTFVGAHGDPSLNLHSCHAPNGPIHLIASPSPDDPQPCGPGEVLDEWSVIGQAPNDGPRGARGPGGAAGAQGPAGAPGHDGPRYTFRIASASGARSVTVRCRAGELALSGGWTTGAGAAVTGSRRSAPGAWTIQATGAPARAGRSLGKRGSSLTAYAVCAKGVAR